MSDDNDNPWRRAATRPFGATRDKKQRQRERDRATESVPPHREGPRSGARAPAGGSRPGPSRETGQDTHLHAQDTLTESQSHARPREQRLYGVNACMAMFVQRPQDLRKVYLLESRIPHIQPVLAHCVKNKLGYRVVGEEDLQKLTQSTHHEGLCFDVLPRAELSLSTWLQSLQGPKVAIWLDGVGNPHNFGAILRSAAHFGAAVLLPKYDPLALSGAAARVAEGGAEMVALVRLGRSDNAIAQLQAAGFGLAATVVRGGSSVFQATLSERLVLVMGAEGEGVDAALLSQLPQRLMIPGTGDVESLNVASATAVFLSQWAARHS